MLNAITDYSSWASDSSIKAQIHTNWLPQHHPDYIIITNNYLRIENAEGNVLIGVYLFIYLYACYSHK